MPDDPEHSFVLRRANQALAYLAAVADADTITVGLMRDLRGIGETNALAARRHRPMRRDTLAQAAAVYAERFGLADDRSPAPFEILFLTGWSP
jgi:NADH dehydrogenase [ubiquinone] 1 alpha subcomplex assembly factor 5